MRRAGRPALLRVVAQAFAVAVALAAMVGLAGCGDGEDSSTTLASTSSSIAATTPTTAPAPTVPTTEPSVTTAVPPTTAAPTTAAPTTAGPTTAPPTTATEPSATTTPEPLSSAETLLPDGTIKGMGFIDKVWEKDGVRYLRIDYAEMLTGEEARQAAIEAGEIAPDEDLPNDYYIRNVNPKKREFTVSPSVEIRTSTRWAPHDGWGAACTWADFVSFWDPGPLPEGDSHLHAVPWWIIRDGTMVISIEEQYIP